MHPGFVLWSAVLITSLSVTGLALRYLAQSGVPLSQSLVLRGLVSLALVLGWAYVRKMSLLPKSIKTQAIRALIAGLALTFFSLSYNWLSASTVSVLSNMDVPMLVILGTLVGQASSAKAKILSAISLVILTVYGLKLQQQTHWFYGVSALTIGLFLLCFGYYFIKKSMSEENRAITVLTPSIAIIVYGLLQQGLDSQGLSQWNISTVVWGVVSGLGMFGAYYATMKLYVLTDIATAEFPTLLSSIVIQPLELVLFGEPVSLAHFALSVAFILCTYFILYADRLTSEVTYVR